MYARTLVIRPASVSPQYSKPLRHATGMITWSFGSRGRGAPAFVEHGVRDAVAISESSRNRAMSSPMLYSKISEPTDAASFCSSAIMPSVNLVMRPKATVLESLGCVAHPQTHPSRGLPFDGGGRLVEAPETVLGTIPAAFSHHRS